MKKTLIIGCLLGWLLSGCTLFELAQAPQSESGVEVLATVNGVSLTRSDLNKRMALVQIAAWLATGSAPADQDESRFVDKWIDSELMAQAAAKAGVGATEAGAHSEIARLLAEAKLGETDLSRQLELVGLAHQDFVQYEQRALAVQKFTKSNIWEGASEVEKSTKLATWLVRERSAAKIEKPSLNTRLSVGAYAGALASNFRLKDLQGNEHELEKARGKVVLINFWATWCGPCRREMPAIQAVYEAHHADGLEVWAVNVAEPREQVVDFVRELGLTFTVLLDGDSKASRQYRVFALPSTVFVGRDGVIKQVVIGEMSASSLDGYVDRLLR